MRNARKGFLPRFLRWIVWVSSLLCSAAFAQDTQPPGPASVLSLVRSGSSAILTWRAATDNVGVTAYVVERCLGTGCTFAQVASVPATTYVDANLAPGVYSYRVRARDAAGNIGPFMAPVAIPMGVAETETYTYDELGRLRSMDYGNGYATLYTLDAAGNRTAVATVGSPGSVYLVSPPASVAETTTSLSFVVGRVSGSAGAASVACRTVNGSATAGSDFVALDITLSWPDGDAGNRTCTVTLSDDSLYEGNETFTLQLTNVVGGTLGGPSSQVVTIVENDPVPDTTPPIDPRELGATSSNSTVVSLNWTGSTDAGGSGLASYRIERCTGSGCIDFNEIGSATGAGYNDTTTAELTTYSYRVRARDGANNNSGYSNTASVTTPDTIPPSVPTGVTANAISASEINVTWSSSNDGIGSGVWRYRVWRGSVWINDYFGNSATDVLLSPNTTYSYTVAAIDHANNMSAPSASASATTHPPPLQAPQTPAWTSNWNPCLNSCITWGSEVLTWNVPGGGAPSHYPVQYSDNGGQTWVNDAGSPTTSLFVSIPWGGTRLFRVGACNATGCSGYSSPLRFFYDPNP